MIKMKSESIKIFTGTIDCKFGRIEFSKMLEEWENEEDKEYDQSLLRLAKLIDETANLIQIMKLEELDESDKYQDLFKKLNPHGR